MPDSLVCLPCRSIAPTVFENAVCFVPKHPCYKKTGALETEADNVFLLSARSLHATNAYGNGFWSPLGTWAARKRR